MSGLAGGELDIPLNGDAIPRCRDADMDLMGRTVGLVTMGVEPGRLGDFRICTVVDGSIGLAV